jgi:hypothetical protein
MARSGQIFHFVSTGDGKIKQYPLNEAKRKRFRWAMTGGSLAGFTKHGFNYASHRIH